MEDDSPSFGLTVEDQRFLLQRQYAKYREIRDKTSRIFQLVLSFVGLIASIGFIQILFSGNVRVAQMPVSADLANRCAPEALTHSGVTLRGLGSINYWLVGGMLILVLYLFAEMWRMYSQSQSLPTLRPQSELELYVYDYSDFLELNRTHLKDAQEYLSAIKRRLYYASTLAGMSAFLLVLLDYSRALLLLIADYAILLVGFGLLLYWGYRYSRTDDAEIFQWRTYAMSPVFILLFTLVWIFLLTKMYQIFLLLDYFFIC
ncbi:hypothetical protein [Haloarcula sp. 1CSR25-25]|jgi:hypothetical protein|uniref:hypothetical protein n=1 Tax=Haloarcula sp. 1CSR25-25 TaxID=2862545 RepID=UPI0028945E18|nr:hypothetical protein [Haloarcula sp. 1CSR25-25]MDT3437952.1 hypothetical protein [Haloarcula sp. 1CSR25-25]